MFITLEGGEGSGKTTVANSLRKIFEEKGYVVVYTREPGGNKIAEAIREVILSTEHTNMDARTEALLYAAARRQHLVEVIEPALAANKIVICDRFIDSSIAYQGYARGIGADLIASMNYFAIDSRLPDLTLLIDVRPKVGLARINQDKNREINRLDLEKMSFHDAVYEGYHSIAKSNPDRIQVVNGEQDVEDVINDLTKIIEARLG